VFPYLSALENALVFKGTLQMSWFTLLTYLSGLYPTCPKDYLLEQMVEKN